MIRILTCCLAGALALLSMDETAVPLTKQKAELGKIQALVGAWKGVGQPQRGAAAGSWTEESEWKWHFDEKNAELVFSAPKGKYFSGGTLRYVGGEKPFSLTAKGGDADAVYQGGLHQDGSLTLDAEKPGDNLPARLTLRLTAGNDRMVLLLEKKSGQAFTRMAEIGATRKGSGFGKGTTYVECIVTGGLGTIEVTHEGKTYHVCCTGCLEVFKDDPAGTVKEYLARKEAEKANLNPTRYKIMQPLAD